MRSLNEMLNSGQRLTRKERAAVERYIWQSSDVISLGDDFNHLQGADRKEKVKWYKTWSNN
jgi:hypothetical protein